MYQNVTSMKATCFLKGVELVNFARGHYELCSENYTYPYYSFGSPRDRYYAEIWEDGMDWQSTYWLIEAFNYNEPVVYPFIRFYDVKQTFVLHWEFESFIQHALEYRRNLLWIKDERHTAADDLMWPFLYLNLDGNFKTDKNKILVPVYFEHASQPKICFEMNKFCISDRVYSRIGYFSDTEGGKINESRM